MILSAMILRFNDNFITFLILQKTLSFVFLTRQSLCINLCSLLASHFSCSPNLGVFLCFYLASYVSNQLASYYLRGFIYSMKLFLYRFSFFLYILFIIVGLITALILYSYYYISNKGFQLSQLHSKMTADTNLRECSNFVP